MTVPSWPLRPDDPHSIVFGHGIGTVPHYRPRLVFPAAHPALTYAAIRSVDPAIIEAGLGIGGRAQVLLKCRFPCRSVIFAGVRVAVVMSIGIGAIAAYIGAGGLVNTFSTGLPRPSTP
jgi:osmoprotectant transport system permease protein